MSNFGRIFNNNFDSNFKNLDGLDSWTPAEITTIGWWDASDTSPANIIQSGGLVSQLSDIGTNANQHLAQATGARQMSTGLQTVNGLNVLSSLIDDRFMETLTFPIPASGNVSISLIARIDSALMSAFSSLISMNAAADDWQLQADNTTQFDGSLRSSCLGGTVDIAGGPYTGPDIWTLKFDWDNSLKSVFVNSVPVGSSNYVDSKLALSQELRIFTNRGSSTGIFGIFGEMVITEDCSCRSIIETYLSRKWGVQI